MTLPPSGHRREAGLTLWIVGWLSSLPVLAMSPDEPSWPLAAIVSLSLVLTGLYLVREGRRGPPARIPRDAP